MTRPPWEPSDELCQKAYDFIEEHLRMFQYPPTMREITAAMGWRSSASASLVVRRMEDLGWITRSLDRRRIIRLTRGESNGQG